MSKKCTVIAFIVIGVAGTLLHFVYEWSGNNPFVGIFSAVNESVWEHQKLLFFPALLYSVIEYFLCGRRNGNYPAAAAVGIFAGIASIIILFYTYSGILGYSLPVVDIILFFVGVLVFLLVRNKIINTGRLNSPAANITALAAVAVLCALFVLWTFMPPQISLFIPKAE